MDPFVQAARRFSSRCSMFWKLGKTPVLRAVAPPSLAADLVQVLRWEEAQPQCRRPLVLIEDPFTGTPADFETVTRRLLDAYAILQTAARDAGTPLPDVAPAVSTEPVVSAVQTAERAAAALPPTLDGLTVALVPERVHTPADWLAQAGTLLKTVAALSKSGPDGRGRRVRWILHDAPAGPLAELLGAGVELGLDEGALFAWWRDSTASRATPLRRFMADGVEALRAGEHDEAITSFRLAQAECAKAGQLDEEAAVLLAIGGTQLGARAPSSAAVSYSAAADLATTGEAWSVACQGKLGEAGAELLQKRHRPAALAYGDAAALAEKARSTPLRIEALRMAGHCHLLAGDKQETLRHWRGAVDAGLELDEAAREETSFAQVANDLVELLRRLGMPVLAVELEGKIAAASGAPPEKASHEGPLAAPPWTAMAPDPFATQPIPVLMPRRALPFVRGPVDLHALDALVAACDAGRADSLSAPAAIVLHATEEIRPPGESGPPLPFAVQRGGPENATQPIKAPAQPKAIPFAEGGIDPRLFRK